MLSLHYDRYGNLYPMDELIDPVVNTTTPAIDGVSAVLKTMDYYGIPLALNLQIKEEKFTPNGEIIFDRGMISASDIEARLVYYPQNNNSLILAWQTQMHTLDRQHYYITYIDALTGDILDREDKVLHCEFGGGLHYDASPEEQAIIDAQHHAMHMEAAQKWDEMMANRTKMEQQVMVSGSMMATEFTYSVLKEPAEAPHDLDAYDEPITLVNNKILDVDELPQMEVTTAGDPTASPRGWHDIQSTGPAAEFTYTQGNNVWAFHDPSVALLGGVPNPSPEYSAQRKLDGTYNYVWDLEQEPEFQSTAEPLNAFPNRNAATTNLFYWNNLIHDVFFHFGLDEDTRNFQRTNYVNQDPDRANDEVLAQSQDGGGVNNANFLTLRDGVNGQMQMYLWTAAVIDQMVQLSTGEKFEAIEGSLYNQAAPGPNARVKGPEDNVENVEIVLLNDGCTGGPTNSTGTTGCGTGAGGAGLPPCNDVNGKIVMIDRGDCSFVEKAHGAQQGGAVGVIVMNNNQANPDEAIAMGGTDPTGNTINIPSVMVSYNNGLKLKAAVAAGTVMGKLQRNLPTVPKKDGDFDNGIIAHEYGHGISNRLSPQTDTGGSLSGDEQGGEGWSDYIALYMTLTDKDLLPETTEHPNGILPDRGIGSYIRYTDYDGPGIRPRKYSISLEENEYTFAGDTNCGSGIDNFPEIRRPHGVGFIWCTMMYEMTQKLVDRYGISDEPNRLYIAPNSVEEISSLNADGMNVAMRLILKGIELQAQRPTFVQQRDAILQADAMLFDGIHSCDIWKAFAKRGLGVDAQDGSNTIGDERDGYGLPATVEVNGQDVMCGSSEQIYYDVKISAQDTVSDGTNLVYKITVTNTSHTGSTATNVVLTDELPANTTFVEATGPVSSNTATSVTWTIPTLEADTPLELFLTVKVATNDGADILEWYDFEDGRQGWVASQGGFNQFTYEDDDASNANKGKAYWHTDNFGFSEALVYLTSPVLPTGSGRQFRFAHKYLTDRGSDGGFIETTTDGVNWGRHTDFSEKGYNDALDATFNPAGAGPAFSGLRPGYFESAMNFGDDVTQIRFVFSEDALFGGGEGWWLDDVKIVSNPITIVNDINITDSAASGGRTRKASATTLVLSRATSLAVQLLDLTATPDENAILLDWTTLSEVDNKGFFVERLNDDNRTWTALDFINGQGTSNRKTSYEYMDENVVTNKLYTYRLRQLDENGKVTYSNHVSAQIIDTEVSISLSPNPTKTVTTISIENASPNSQIRLVNVTGQLLRTYSLEEADRQSLDLDVSDLATGIYMIQLQTENGLLVERLMVE